MKRTRISVWIAFIVLAFVVLADNSWSTRVSVSDGKPSFSFDDTETSFERTYTCYILTINVEGPQILRVPDAQHTNITLLYVGGLNPTTEVRAIPTACPPPERKQERR